MDGTEAITYEYIFKFHNVFQILLEQKTLSQPTLKAKLRKIENHKLLLIETTHSWNLFENGTTAKRIFFLSNRWPSKNEWESTNSFICAFLYFTKKYKKIQTLLITEGQYISKKNVVSSILSKYERSSLSWMYSG